MIVDFDFSQSLSKSPHMCQHDLKAVMRFIDGLDEFLETSDAITVGSAAIELLNDSGLLYGHLVRAADVDEFIFVPWDGAA